MSVREVQRSTFYGMYVLHFTKWTSSTFKKCSKQTINLHHEHRFITPKEFAFDLVGANFCDHCGASFFIRCSWCKLMVCFEHFLNVDYVHFVKCNTYILQEVDLCTSRILLFCRPPDAHGELLAANMFPVVLVNTTPSNEPYQRLNLRPRPQGVPCKYKFNTGLGKSL